MDKDKLSPKEEALLAEARREAQARKNPPPPAPAGPSVEAKRAPVVAEAKPAPTAAERLAQLMEEERAETQERKRKMRRNGLLISGSILGVFVLWLLSAFRRRR